jgi:glycosyltransferase involved in cell wall biosynthesis
MEIKAEGTRPDERAASDIVKRRSDNSNLRILMTCTHPGIHGAKPRIIAMLASSLREAGQTLDTAAWGRHSEDESWTTKLLGRCSDLLHIRRCLARGNYDVLFVHTQHDWRTLARDIPLAVLGRRFCPAILLEFHGSQSNRLVFSGDRAFKAASRLLLKHCHGVFVLSMEEMKEWRSFYGKPSYYVVRNPFCADPELTESTASTPSPRRADTPTILFVGRLIRAKGIYELLSAVANIAQDCPCRLLMVGDGPEAEPVKHRITELGIQGRTTLAGHLTGADLIAAYRTASVFTLPSYSEGFPTVISEAMAAGLPIVTTRIRGAADHLAEGVNVLFVSPQDVVALARALRTLLQDADQRAHMGAANLAKVREFAPSKVVQDYVAAIKDVLGQSRSHRRSPVRTGE